MTFYLLVKKLKLEQNLEKTKAKIQKKKKLETRQLELSLFGGKVFKKAQTERLTKKGDTTT